ncbi:MAG: AMP-binding protein [Polyangiaceae bacterium]
MARSKLMETVDTRVRAALFRAGTLVRVGRAKRMHENVRAQGVILLARELAKGKQNPSLIFRFHAANTPHRVGLVSPAPAGSAGGGSGERAWSFFEMNDLMDRYSAGFAQRGIARGAAALLMLKNRPEFILLQPSLGRIGGSAVSVSWRSTPPELCFVAKHSGAKVLVFDAEVADTVRAALPDLGVPREACFVVGGEAEGFQPLSALLEGSPPPAGDHSEEGAVVMYTSGTTGKPKGAVRKFQSSTLAAALAFLGETPLMPNEVHLAVCPLYHATAFGFVGLSYLLGHSVVVLPDFRPDTFLEAVQRYRVTNTALVPTMLQRLVDLGRERIAEYDISSLKCIFSGGSALSGTLARQAMAVLGERVFNFYGATETGLVTLATPRELLDSPGTIGHRVPGVDIRLVDAEGRDVAQNQIGELYARSAMTVDCYHADAEATAKSKLDEYFSVGDLARLDARGNYHIEGRKRDMIISGGVNVYPAELEETIHQHPDVHEVAVVGVADRDLGERVRAFVAVRPGATRDGEALKAWCKQRLSGAKVPREFVFLDALPRNPTGKVLKRELREMRAPGEDEARQ